MVNILVQFNENETEARKVTIEGVGGEDGGCAKRYNTQIKATGIKPRVSLFKKHFAYVYTTHTPMASLISVGHP